MKDTIKARYGYRLHQVNKLANVVNLFEVGLANDKFILTAEVRTYEDYVDEVVNGGNECARKCEVFTDIDGKQFVYWNDYETNEDFLTQISLYQGE